MHKEQGSLKDFCLASDFEAVVDCFIELIQPYRAAPLQAQEAMEHIINLMPTMYSTEKWMFKESAIKEGWYVDLVTVRDKCAARIKRDQKNQKAEPLMIAVPGFLSAVCSADELMLYPEVVGYTDGQSMGSRGCRGGRPPTKPNQP